MTLLDDLSPQFRDHGSRLRLDQLSLSGPGLLVIRPDLGQNDVGRLPPRLNENCARLERWQREFGELPV